MLTKCLCIINVWKFTYIRNDRAHVSDIFRNSYPGFMGRDAFLLFYVNIFFLIFCCLFFFCSFSIRHSPLSCNVQIFNCLFSTSLVLRLGLDFTKFHKNVFHLQWNFIRLFQLLKCSSIELICL